MVLVVIPTFMPTTVVSSRWRAPLNAKFSETLLFRSSARLNPMHISTPSPLFTPTMAVAAILTSLEMLVASAPCTLTASEKLLSTINCVNMDNAPLLWTKLAPSFSELASGQLLFKIQECTRAAARVMFSNPAKTISAPSTAKKWAKYTTINILWISACLSLKKWTRLKIASAQAKLVSVSSRTPPLMSSYPSRQKSTAGICNRLVKMAQCFNRWIHSIAWTALTPTLNEVTPRQN